MGGCCSVVKLDFLHTAIEHIYIFVCWCERTGVLGVWQGGGPSISCCAAVALLHRLIFVARCILALCCSYTGVFFFVSRAFFME